MFIGHHPSHFHVNTIVKAFIISEGFFYSSWNFILPIFSIFVATHVSGGNVQIAASTFSTYLVSRVICELSSGKFLAGASDQKRIFFILTGILLTTISFIGFSMSTTIISVFFFSFVVGCGFGITSPAKYSLFSTHLDKNKETLEWGLYDATIFLGMALAAALGGFIAKVYGFPLLFTIAALVNSLSCIPYLLYLHNRKH